MAMYQNMLVVIDPNRTTNQHCGELFISSTDWWQN